MTGAVPAVLCRETSVMGLARGSIRSPGVPDKPRGVNVLALGVYLNSSLFLLLGTTSGPVSMTDREGLSITAYFTVYYE